MVRFFGSHKTWQTAPGFARSFRSAWLVGFFGRCSRHSGRRGCREMRMLCLAFCCPLRPCINSLACQARHSENSRAIESCSTWTITVVLTDFPWLSVSQWVVTRLTNHFPCPILFSPWPGKPEVHLQPSSFWARVVWAKEVRRIASIDPNQKLQQRTTASKRSTHNANFA